VELPYFKPLNEIETTPVNIPVNPTITETTEYLHKTGGSDLTPASKLKLDALITKLKSSPKSKLEIISHTSCKGDNKLNLALSIKRATIISNYLVLKGIAKIRIKVIGKGETEPLNECIDEFPCTNDELEENNRTVFKISQN
jgi:outer membrane protein OmpA-like peptidoglycan-associated protein